MVELPDVNVLIALFDSTHTHHEAAQNWFVGASQNGWATCPLTENGFLRVVSNPNYPNVHLTAAEAARYLRMLTANHVHSHRFWPDEVSLLDTTLFDLSKVQGYRQLTDLYLLGLCQHHQAAFVSFDSGLQQTLRAVIAPHAALLHLL